MAIGGLDIFPDQMSAGAVISKVQETSIIDYDNGTDDRLNRWPRPKIRATFNTPQLDKATYDTLVEFFDVHQGGTYPFLVKIWTGYSLTDENMVGAVNSFNMEYQLVKGRNSGSRTLDIPIEYADTATWSFVDGADSPLTVDTSSFDMVTFTTAPATGTGKPKATVVTYYVPMVFEDSEINLSVRWEDAASMTSVNLIEWFRRS